MRKLDSRGVMNPLMPALIISIVFLFGAAGFGVWSFMEAQKYKNDYDALVVEAVAAKSDELKAEAEAEYNEREKSPFKNYVGPPQFGNLNITYPKTWAAYVEESSTSGTPVEAHFHPNFVPGLNSIGRTTQFALQVSVLDQTFERVLSGYTSNIKNGKATSQPYAVPQVPDVVGAKITSSDNVAVLLPIRDKTIRVQTFSQTYIGDFENVILANLTFQP